MCTVFHLVLILIIKEEDKMSDICDLDITINTCDLLYMLCDKISVFCTKAVFKQPKDLYDIAMIVSSTDIVLNDLLDAWDKSGSVKAIPVMGFDFTKTGDIKKSYEKFREEFNKPSFESIFETVLRFIGEFLIAIDDRSLPVSIWSSGERQWKSCMLEKPEYMRRFPRV
jgi:hypothetical protein